MIVLVGGPYDGKTSSGEVSETFVWFDEAMRPYAKAAGLRLPSGEVRISPLRALYRFEYEHRIAGDVKRSYLYAGHNYGFCCGDYHRVGAEARKCPNCETKLGAVT